jgi:2-keto-4-pentenoate hydratase/2-oxohepta-3-ene-1,7-dioic acid hydratase in catechol pathway
MTVTLVGAQNLHARLDTDQDPDAFALISLDGRKVLASAVTGERGPQWDKGKGCDTFGPIGPWLVTRDEIANVQKLSMWLDLNGQRMQTGNTKTMIFGVAKLVSYVSEFMTLMPGDIITTGTPPGVGLGMKPPVFLKKGDVMALGIEGLGEQRQLVVPFKL